MKKPSSTASNLLPTKVSTPQVRRIISWNEVIVDAMGVVVFFWRLEINIGNINLLL